MLADLLARFCSYTKRSHPCGVGPLSIRHQDLSAWEPQAATVTIIMVLVVIQQAFIQQ